MASETRYAIVLKMLKARGYMLGRVRGSHHVFTKPGELPLSIPVHKGKVKSYYVRQIEKIQIDS
ncbi:MAG: type II toxin-antitoxin system HicA family toxin [Planctomycetota bacterium]|nr:MAG: type II toxin-antitoxin system HicA family toxin [Planctomycetota bacterium]